MSINSSSLFNSSLTSPAYGCSKFAVSVFIGIAQDITRAVLVLPLCIFVFYLGIQRWRQQRHFTTTSHSDFFTYHMAATQLIWALGIFSFYYSSTNLPEMMMVGFWLVTTTFYGENLFQLLTCVERYLAVVHPVTYLGLRKARGVRIRNISIGCVWLLCFVLAGVISLYHPTYPPALYLCPLLWSLVVVSFCSLSVLRVLILPGPGDRGQDRQHVDQLKKRAFFTIMTIMVVLWLWFGALIVDFALSTSLMLSPSATCVLRASVFWFNLPSSLVLPLLYLHRAGKRLCCCNNTG